jgi:hypothetical protein
LTSGLSNCVEWVDDRAAARVRNNPANQGLQPQEIKRLVIEHALGGCPIHQVPERREQWASRRDYYYEAVVAVEGFPGGLYVEMELSDPDPDLPEVSLLNAHPPSFSPRRTQRP